MLDRVSQLTALDGPVAERDNGVLDVGRANVLAAANDQLGPDPRLLHRASCPPTRGPRAGPP